MGGSSNSSPERGAALAAFPVVVLSEDEDEEVSDELPEPQERSPLAAELRRLLHLSLPIALVGVLSFASRLITTAQVGRLSSAALSRLSLGQTLYNVTGLSLVVGIATGVTTFVGAAHGAHEAALKGVILQRGAAIALLTAVLPLAAWTQAGALLQALGQNPHLASGAAAYVRLASAALPLSAVNNSLANYLSAQQVVRPQVALAATTMALTWPLNHLALGALGYLGAAVTLVSLQAAELLMLLAIAAWHNARQPPELRPWGGLSRAALQLWGPFLQVAAPSMAMILVDWWSFELLTLLAGLQRPAAAAQVAVAAIGVCFGIHVCVFMLVDGAAVAVSVRVANELGAGRYAAARRAVAVGVALGMATTLSCVVPMALLPGQLARLFTSDPEVVAAVVSCQPGLLLSLLGDSIGTVLSGAFRGAGRQALGSAVNFCCYWVLGLPLAAYLSLPFGLGWGPAGLWWAMAATSAVQAAVLAATTCCCLEWQHEAWRAAQLVRSQSATPCDGDAQGEREPLLAA